jgi:hypothetical protein
MRRHRWVDQDGDTGDRRHGFFEDLELPPQDLDVAEIQAGEVAAGPRQTLHEPIFYNLITDRNDNGDGCRRLLGSSCWSVRMQPDNVWYELDQLGSEGGEPVGVPLSIAICKGGRVPLPLMPG